MGWWKFDAWKQDDKEKDIPLDDADLEHIAELIKEGFTEGEVVQMFVFYDEDTKTLFEFEGKEVKTISIARIEDG